ncbi:hypothetical protein BGX38DRAFT_1145418 [Terfezia claveryi]|nr:hypothetical protein BGX38DRAFT_1145418 [Terfezia claveryi]
MLRSPTLHISTHAPQLQDDDLHTQSTSTSLPSPPSSEDPPTPSGPKASTISQGPSLPQISRSRSQEPSSSLAAPTFAIDTRQRLITQQQGASHTRSQSLCSRPSPISSSIVRNGKSETYLYGLIENSSYPLNPNTQLRMLAAEGTPATCFTLTSPLLPPSLASTSATAPPPSSSSNSRKKPKTRLTLNALPRFPQPPSHAQSHMSSGLSSSMNTHYQYNVQPTYQYSQHSYAQQQSSYLSAQQQLQIHQKDLIQQATRGTLPSHHLFPSSPRLIPMGSPGPVTPLTLEEAQGGYLFAGSPSNTSSMPFMQQRDIDKLTAIAASQN